MVNPVNHVTIEMLLLLRPEIANFYSAKYLKITNSQRLIFANISSFTVLLVLKVVSILKSFICFLLV